MRNSVPLVPRNSISQLRIEDRWAAVALNCEKVTSVSPG